MLPFDDPVQSIQLMSGRLEEIARSPSLIVLNLVFGLTLAVGFYFSSSLARRNSKIVWLLGLFLILAGAFLFYFWQYPPGEYYREADVPGGQFAHMVLFMTFPLAPLLAVISYIAGGFFSRYEAPRARDAEGGL